MIGAAITFLARHQARAICVGLACRAAAISTSFSTTALSLSRKRSFWLACLSSRARSVLRGPARTPRASGL